MDAEPFGEPTAKSIRVLHVDDQPDFLDLTKDFLESQNDAITVTTETRAQAGLDQLKSESFDCIVSDYNMPNMDGLEFLQAVRGPFPEIPFILFTGRGSEEVASEAISNGVTDYLQKGGPDQYKILLNQIQNSVVRYRTEHELERSRDFLDRVLNLSPSAVIVMDGTGGIIRANDKAQKLLGLSQFELAERTFDDVQWTIVDPNGEPIPDDALPFARVAETGEPVYDVEHGIQRPDGETVWVSINAAPLWEDTGPLDYVVALLTIESTTLENRLRQKTKIGELEDVGHILSHDLGNILNIASGRLELARETGDEENFKAVEQSLIRANNLLTDLTGAIRSGRLVDELSVLSLSEVFTQAWESQETENARRSVTVTGQIKADEDALLQMFENLIRNSIEHGDKSVEIRLGDLPNGFYIEDDGPGIPEENRKSVFELGTTEKTEGSGVGLFSVRQIALAHGWNIKATEGSDGGARFEFRNVVRVSDSN